MPQNKDEMMFCEKCKMNVFPSRPPFNVKAFGACAVISFLIILPIFLTTITFLSSIFFSLYFMWGFMLINPYLLYYGLQKTHFCPRCHQEIKKTGIAPIVVLRWIKTEFFAEIVEKNLKFKDE